ncbi:hypothetical protein TNCV_1946481 [Trichonephila clavipes]|uniref:Uncharacterized protein n=1 Tax=Trichonephila clavipes TaxID=2585209 RepID=A0A8X6VJL8_TRICX|nr:hypothetical protein TNCV_1946481 [Trichonephila clavipes]
MLEKSSKIGCPDWTTSEPAVAVLCQKSYLKLRSPGGEDDHQQQIDVDGFQQHPTEGSEEEIMQHASYDGAPSLEKRHSFALY